MTRAEKFELVTAMLISIAGLILVLEESNARCDTGFVIESNYNQATRQIEGVAVCRGEAK